MRSKIIAANGVISTFSVRFKSGVTRQETASEPATILRLSAVATHLKKPDKPNRKTEILAN